jgi:hypothetical protein
MPIWNENSNEDTSNLIIKKGEKMKRSTHQLVSERDLTGSIDFTPEFTKSEKNTLRRFGYAPLPGSPYLHSSNEQWIEKIERVDYTIKHNNTRLYGVIETNRVLTYSLVERRSGSCCLNTTLAEDTDFKSFSKKIRMMYEPNKKK